MTTQKYHGRHRGQTFVSPDETPAPRVVPMGTDGRHREPGARALPRLAGTGALLPTAAIATIVLTTTGVHLGATPAPAPVIAVPAVSTLTSAPPAGPTPAEVVEAKIQRQATPPRGPVTRSSRSATRPPAPSAAVVAARTRAAVAAKAAARRAATHRWVTPLDGRFQLTSGYGMRWGSLHPGQDFAMAVGSPLKAMSSGVVVFAGWSGGYGNKVEIRYWDGTVSWYAHNSRLTVRDGQAVTPGEVVALSGNTGHSTGPHSHIEIHLHGDDTPASAVPPLPWFAAHGNLPGTATSARSAAARQ